MINAAAIVEQTAEIFASRARPMVPFSDKYEARYFVELTSGEAEVFGGILYTFRLSDMTGCYAL